MLREALALLKRRSRTGEEEKKKEEKSRCAISALRYLE